MTTEIERYKKAAFFAFGNIAAEIISQPLYSIKTNYQTSNNKSITNAAKKIYNTKGIFGFYNAISTAIFARIVSAFIKFLIYGELKYYRNTRDDDILNNMLNGVLCGSISSIFVHPIDTVTNNLQRFKNIKTINFSIKMLYGGFSQTLLRNAMLYSILFPLFDYCNHMTNNVILACIMTSLTSSTILQPVEYIRTRYMAGMYEKTWSNYNYKILFKGWRITTLANISHFTLAMSIAKFMNEKYINF
jgi:hypothetical protein